MAIPSRNERKAGTYFVTSRTWESRNLFLNGTVCVIFVETLLHYREESRYLLHGFVVLPEHFHVLITPAEGVTVERAVQFIKGGSARRIREERKLAFPVWQRGFSDHRIRDAEDFDAHMRYIEQNPVKRRLAEAPGEYTWSSASRAFALDDWPQRLKPLSSTAQYGTAKAVP